MASPASLIQPADIAVVSFRAAAVGMVVMLAAGCTTATPIESDDIQADVAFGSAADSPAALTTPPASPEPQPPPDADSLNEQQKRQLQVFSATLLSASADIDAETRRSAAQELLVMNRPESLAVIDRALRGQTPAVMLAAITAMQTNKPVAALLEPAVAALSRAPATVIEPLSWVIARHSEPAVRLVAPLATDRSAAISARLGPIRALGAFDSQSAAASLMTIINNPAESVEAINAACDSLQRLTGLSYNSDIRQWRSWWDQAGSLAEGEWSTFINQSLSKRAAQLQQDLQRQREVSDRIARELFNAYRDLYPALPVDEQMRRLSAMLQDPLPPLREFAISRIALLLRDSVRIPAELQHKLADRLNDDVPMLRIEAAKLLDELNYETIGPLLASRLAGEQSPLVIATFLDVLSRRPAPAAIEPARRWLSDANLGTAAGNAIWRALHVDNAISPDALVILRDELCRTLAQRQSTAALRVLALIGSEDDVARLTEALDGDNPAIRASIAEGLCQRGLREPLIQRAADPAVFPFAVRAIVDGPADVAGLRRLIALAPPEEHHQAWLDGCLNLCERLPPRDLAAADDLLVATSSLDGRIRTGLLTRATSLPREDLSREHRETLVQRYATLLIEQGEPAKAHGLLESIGCNAPETSELCFQAAALAGHYEKAWQVHETAGEWLALLERVADRDLTLAAPLWAEIARRFEGRLAQDEQQTLDRVARLLREAAASASAAGGRLMPFVRP